MKTALTIAGSDSSGGAGIQADIKTMMAHRIYAMSAVTALTAQNTTGVTQIFNVSAEFLEKQIDAVFTDIYPDAVKIGMVSEEELIKVIAKRLIYYKAGNIVIDPVMVSTSGARLISENAVAVLRNTLLPLADLITPNIPEAEVLTGKKIEKAEDMEVVAAEIYREFGCSVLLKGGHQIHDANDLSTGFGERELKIQIHMEQAVRFLLQLHQIWQREKIWSTRWQRQRIIFHWRLVIC